MDIIEEESTKTQQQPMTDVSKPRPNAIVKEFLCQYEPCFVRLDELREKVSIMAIFICESGVC